VPITVAALSKVWTVFPCSNAGIMGSNPAQGMDVRLCLFCVCIGSGLAMGWSPVQGVLPTLPTVLGLRNWRETKRFTDALCYKVGATGKREIVGGVVQLGPLGTAAINRPIVPAPGDNDDGEICGMMIGWGNRSTQRKPAPVLLCPPQTPHARPGREPEPPQWEASD
jgi:hypothetical protein